ncbi:GNAT family N-acetyltransferase [Tamlana sp. 2201CG12-4]|uniref:GNAT family N-acetyltransferase n=1 Tax=Tamlana sp. 2201CG12-4 TaxID=3112582 RepID=UPI002DBF49A9|nr:GNAT family N-acetyltransferase [Tamlana sp. 2201CG12-4]MEC3908822.1 GNAT family N-acetyltransferase [Tamlana sp. 2201CG12-4]
MENTIINNLFELWRQASSHSQFLHNTAAYNFAKSNNNSWPSKVFELKESLVNLQELYSNIKKGTLPNSISILENEALEARLLEHKFILKSTVKGMYLDLQKKDKPQNDFSSIEKIDTNSKVIAFAQIASISFNYEILSSTIISLINSSQLQLFIGKYNGKPVSCGMILLDQNRISGLHMIGTIPEYRGLGLGKVMTQRLLFEAHENESKQAVLVASESGERIYSKLGFITQGNLKSYSINK